MYFSSFCPYFQTTLSSTHLFLPLDYESLQRLSLFFSLFFCSFFCALALRFCRCGVDFWRAAFAGAINASSNGYGNGFASGFR